MTDGQVHRLPASKPPRAPKGLESSGGRLWRAVTGTYELRCDELALLEQACRTLDRIEALDATVGDELTVEGSTGQIVVHPAVAESRQQRLVLSRLVRQLGLPEHDDDTEQLAKSWRARRAVRERWSPDGAVARPVAD